MEENPAYCVHNGLVPVFMDQNNQVQLYDGVQPQPGVTLVLILRLNKSQYKDLWHYSCMPLAGTPQLFHKNQATIDENDDLAKYQLRENDLCVELKTNIPSSIDIISMVEAYTVIDEYLFSNSYKRANSGRDSSKNRRILSD
ncbi:hypothetical protein VNO77_44381 [Canavalia gladiata]|uniref:Uncharacterized protein n=1 Tax=Canavalia gladiata TaxID=3824 RepID=A0AAN9PQB1_CANGL